jgi:hypothetical protein
MATSRPINARERGTGELRTEGTRSHSWNDSRNARHRMHLPARYVACVHGEGDALSFLQRDCMAPCCLTSDVPTLPLTPYGLDVVGPGGGRTTSRAGSTHCANGKIRFMVDSLRCRARRPAPPMCSQPSLCLPRSALLAWIERVPEAIADEVEGKHGEGNRDARSDHHVRVVPDIVLAIRKHGSP